MIWDHLISRVLAREGGWSDRTEDKGGPTNMGITLGTFAAWKGKDLSKTIGNDRTELVLDLKSMTEGEARSIYLQRYVKDTGLELLASDALQEAMFDWVVNSGPKWPIMALQRELAVGADGVLGPTTAEAAAKKDGNRLAMRVCFARVEFIANWMRRDKRDADRDGVPDSMENAAGILLRIVALARGIAI